MFRIHHDSEEILLSKEIIDTFHLKKNGFSFNKSNNFKIIDPCIFFLKV